MVQRRPYAPLFLAGLLLAAGCGDDASLGLGSTDAGDVTPLRPSRPDLDEEGQDDAGGGGDAGLDGGGGTVDPSTDAGSTDVTTDATPAPDADTDVETSSDAISEDADGDDRVEDGSTDGATDATGADGREDADPQTCVPARSEATQVRSAVDIVWVIDTSTSMRPAVDRIEANLNRFAARLGVDVGDARVVVIAADRSECSDGRCYLPVCVPPPLSGAAGCPDTDSPRYRHVRRGVHSRDSLMVAQNTYPEWRDALRAGAALHMIFVTDDNHAFNRGQDAFLAFLQDPARVPVPSLIRIHSIVDPVGSPPGCGIFDDDCSCGQNAGLVYMDLSERTGGTVQSLCLDDWSPIFDAVEERVDEDTLVPCTYALPSLPPDRLLDRVNVFRDSAGTGRVVVPLVAGPSGCGSGPAWYFDDLAAPSAVVLCPDACDDETRRIEVELGCESVKL
jgi:hypothetical protein